MQLNEDSLKAGDLRNLVSHIFEVDCYKSKMGDDKDVVVISFTVEGRSPAEDLVSFIEKGYQFVLDADMTPGELSNGKYQVFIEIQRDKHVADQISEMLYGLGKLTAIENFKFRYHKSFNSLDAVKEQLSEVIPNDPQSYETRIKERQMESYEGFFSSSMLESIVMQDDILEFRKVYAEPIRMRLVTAGKTQEVLESIEDRVSVGMNDMADIMFLTKYIGNYNINKMGNKYMFENSGHAVILEKI
jgi:hypothetical protein